MQPTINLKQIFRLRNSVQHYAWGSTKEIPMLLGIENKSNMPYAELWLGSHPKAPSRVLLVDEREISLIDLIKLDPSAILGGNIVKKYGERLPFLFKALAAGKPLSIQAHPSKEQAKQGFLRENEQGIAIFSAQRNYKDSNHKPELIMALSPFTAMCGFRPVEQIIEEFKRLDIKSINNLVNDLKNNKKQEGLKVFFHSLMSLPVKQKEKLIPHVVKKFKNSRGPAHYWLGKLQTFYANDIGVLCPLFLNLVQLKPGEAMFLPARVLHSYLHGFGLEIMANSDNVLRGGLTPKHIDVGEMLRVLSFSPLKPQIVHASRINDYEAIYPVNIKEFSLARICLKKENAIKQKTENKAAIYLVINGKFEIKNNVQDRPLLLQKGDSVFVPASVTDFIIEGKGMLYKASSG